MKNTIITLASVAVIAGSVNAQTYDYTTDFSNSSNPNGVWNYLTYDAGTTGNFAGDWSLAYNGTGTGDWDSATAATGSTPVIGSTSLHPDGNEHDRYGVWFIAPTAGVYNFEYQFTNLDQGGTREVEIGVFGGGLTTNIANYTEGTGTGLQTGTLNLAANQAVQFWVANGDGSNSGDFVTVNSLKFTAVPEPSSTALLGLGGLALILRRKK